MATRTSIGDGLWSEAGTWDTGVPVDTDTVVIANSHTVTFDVDTSGFASGIAGLTCTGTFQCSTSPGTYHLKMAGNITGAGSFLAGTAGVPLPATVKFNIQMNGSWRFSGVGTLAIYGTNPVTPYVKLTALEPIAETVMAVDTDVTTDIWAAGDLVRLCDITQSQETEQHTIDSVAAGTITLTGGLSASKSIGAYLLLCSRNIRIYGHTANTYCVNNCTNAVLQCEIYGGNTLEPSTSNAGNGVTSSTGVVVSGAVHGCSRGCNLCASGVFSGTISGNYYGCNLCASGVFSGTISGNSFGCSLCASGVFSGTISGNSFGCYNCDAGVFSGVFTGCDSGCSTCYGGIFSGAFNGSASGCHLCGGGVFSGMFTSHLQGCYQCSGGVFSGTFTGNSYGCRDCWGGRLDGATFNNTQDIRSCYALTGIGTTLGGSTQAAIYTGTSYRYSLPAVVIRNSGGVSDAVKAWMNAGRIATDAAVYPTGYTYSQKFIFEDVNSPLYLDWPFWLEKDENLVVDVFMIQDGTGRTEVPRCQIIDPADDPIYKTGGAALSEEVMTDNTDWQTFTLTHTADHTGEICVRTRGMNASGNYWAHVVRRFFGGAGTQETTTKRTGANALKLANGCKQRFQLPVNASETTISIWARYNGDYAGTLPTFRVRDGAAIGVADAESVMVDAQDTWEQLSLVFTPSSVGIVSIEFLHAGSAGFCYWDDWSVV